MQAVQKLFERAKHLSPDQLSELAARIEDYLSSLGLKKRSTRSYARSLALSGTADSDWADVSSHKGRHLAEVYAARREG